MWIDSRFDKQLYLTIYMDVGLSGMDPKKHFKLYGHAENRQKSLRNSNFGSLGVELENEIIYLLKNGSVIKKDKINSNKIKKSIEIWEIKWRPKRPEWGWLIVVPTPKPNKEIDTYAYLRTIDECIKIVGDHNYKTLQKVFRDKFINISQSKNVIYIFINLGFNATR